MAGDAGRRVVVYSRKGCHLCELLIEEVLSLTRDRAIVDVIDIDRDASLALDYGERIPVVEVDGRFVCEHRLDRQALARVLSSQAAAD